MKIGIDFGSTYSVFSAYNSAEHRAEVLTLTEGDPPTIPSVVSVTKAGRFTCGKGAKEQIGKKTVRIFEAFKMLLPTPNQNMLTKRGYDADYTPRRITSEYLDSVLSGLLDRYGEKDESIDGVVICVPEIWGEKVNTLDGRNILRQILTGKDTAQGCISTPIEDANVKIITEPEAASAYIAYSYEKKTGKAFNGHLLLIDYGGGTLDLTLTEITSDGKGMMEMGYREGGGEGENHPDSDGNGAIGSAGIAYMQDVVKSCLLANGIDEGELSYTSPMFMEAVRDLESQLKSPDRMREIEDTFGGYGAYEDFEQILDGEDIEFSEIEYNEEAFSVTYQQLFSSYQNVIQPVFASQLEIINPKVEKHIGCDPRQPKAGAEDSFKIALVGGFGSFYLVKKQMEDFYSIDPNNKLDLRVNATTGSKKEHAISLGAALVASDKIILKKIARYSIGIYAPRHDGVFELHYGIKYHQYIEPGKPYYICNADEDDPEIPQNRITYGSLRRRIENFAIGFDESTDHGGLMRLKQEMLQRLDTLPQDGFWNLGFSMDRNDIVSFHVVPSAMMECDDHEGVVLALESYSRMFDLTDVKEVWSNEA